MGKLVIVGISDQKIAISPDSLITYALGSCVGICIHDTLKQIGGLAHVLLPETFGDNSRNDVYKFADLAVKELVRNMEKQGCARLHLTAKIAGGANMFITTGTSIGERNVEVVKKELKSLRIRLLAEDTGANYGRTVEFNPFDGKMIIKTAGKGNKIF